MRRAVVDRGRRRLLLGAMTWLTACTSDAGYRSYADRLVATGDSALLAVEPLAGLDSTGPVVWDADASSRLERHATAFGAILHPDTTATLHRQMLDGLDSLVVAMRVLHAREERCGRAHTPDCADAHDFGRILASIHHGQRIYLQARSRMAAVIRQFGVRMKPPPKSRAGR